MHLKRIAIAGWTALALVSPFLAIAGGSPIRDPKAKAGDCAACHKAEKVLPAGHVATKELKYGDCVTCHAKGSAQALTGKIPAAHVHQLNGVGCVKCHPNLKKAETTSLAQCASCHGKPADLAEKTANVKPENPHKSPHWGPEMECTACHQQHAKTIDYCGYCHRFDFKVP